MKVKKYLMLFLLCIVGCTTLIGCGKPSSGTGKSKSNSTRTIVYDSVKKTAKLSNVTFYDELSQKKKTLSATVSVQDWSKSQIIFSYKSTTYAVAISTSSDEKYITFTETKEKYALTKKK